MTEPTEERTPPAPSIPLLLFAAVDLALACFLLLDDGFSLEFWLIAVIGVALAAFGLRGVRRPRPAE